MYIAVCDDQAAALNALTGLLDAWQAERKVSFQYKTFRNAIELLDAAEKERFSLYLLDVMMPGTNGMAAAREIRGFDTTAEIVFLTSSPDFAFESYSVHARDYLLKPIRAEQLFPLLDRLSLREQQPQNGLTLKSGATLTRIPYSQLVYVEVIRKHLYFTLTDGSVCETPGALSDYEAQLLTQPQFLRVGRSYIVNVMQIKELSPAGIVTFSGKQIPVPRRLFPQLQKDYMRLLFSREEEE